jgi:multidrug efflux pump
VEEFKRLVVRQQDGAIVRLEDIGDVVLGAEDYDRSALFRPDGRFHGNLAPAQCQLRGCDQPGAEQGDGCRQNQLPQGLQARIAYDATNYIRNAIREVIKTLSETLLIVVVIIFLFLGSLRSAIIPVVAIPCPSSAGYS